MILWTGVLGVGASVAWGLIVIVSWSLGRIAQPGYTASMVALFFFAALILMAQGLVGGYVWRAFENTKGRPCSITMLHETFTPQRTEVKT